MRAKDGFEMRCRHQALHRTHQDEKSHHLMKPVKTRMKMAQIPEVTKQVTAVKMEKVHPRLKKVEAALIGRRRRKLKVTKLTMKLAYTRAFADEPEDELRGTMEGPHRTNAGKIP
ncbi:hypothetical protein BIW11_00467 [Tropilaelaps mercedesae]|uniref:Uncharacterized protein n=1 Tax=Tropilaelaps mercedesae TaxID=418985 RepID=A0A1V9XUY7_9ACAR|nr:hypothetical protein BIW11_00467 [Tropilaelaps mercedesae]